MLKKPSWRLKKSKNVGILKTELLVTSSLSKLHDTGKLSKDLSSKCALHRSTASTGSARNAAAPQGLSQFLFKNKI